MKKQRKLLTSQERYDICQSMKSKTGRCPSECPLMDKILTQQVCVAEVEALENWLRAYWNKEIEVNG